MAAACCVRIAAVIAPNQDRPIEEQVEEIVKILAESPENVKDLAFVCIYLSNVDRQYGFFGRLSGSVVDMPVYKVIGAVYDRLDEAQRALFWDRFWELVERPDRDYATSVKWYDNFSCPALALEFFCRKGVLPLERLEPIMLRAHTVPRSKAWGYGKGILHFVKTLTGVEGVKEKYPFLTRIIEEDEATIREAMKGCYKTHYVPLVRHGDTTNPRSIKFGGCIPYRPNDGPPVCRGCSTPLGHIASIYVGLLPDPIKKLFKEEDYDMLIRLTFCVSCWVETDVELFRGAELDDLCWNCDQSPAGYLFNEPRVFTGWKEQQELPPELSSEYTDSIEGFTEETRKALEKTHLHYKVVYLRLRTGDGEPETHAGGYGFFTQGPENPSSDYKMVFQFAESEASTGMWGDAGTGHLWVSQEDYGDVQLTWACY